MNKIEGGKGVWQYLEKEKEDKRKIVGPKKREKAEFENNDKEKRV